MVYFHTKNPNSGILCRASEGKMLVFLWPFGIFYGNLVTLWYIFPRFGTLYQENSGHPGLSGNCGFIISAQSIDRGSLVPSKGSISALQADQLWIQAGRSDEFVGKSPKL
jgi:hypothetical protein